MEEGIAAPLRFVKPPISHLVCGICGKVFTDPVISTTCGHTYCRLCIAGPGGAVTCPVDGVGCKPEAIVTNRALQGQLDDLEVYCKNGLVWSEEKQGFDIDPTGCKELIKLGTREEHERSCPYNMTPCPNNEEQCGRFRQQDLDQHLKICVHVICRYKLQGCEFRGRQDEINWHSERCGYRPGAKVSPIEVEELRRSNSELQKTVSTLTQRVADLEQKYGSSTDQLNEALDTIKSMENKYTDIHTKLDKLLKLSRSNSTRSSSSSSGSSHPAGLPGTSTIVRTPSTSSISSAVVKRVESWTMPFQFKCIGTLRAHKGALYSLITRGVQVFSAGDDNVIKVWNMDSLAKGHRKTLRGHTGCILKLAVNDVYLYSTGVDKSIRAWSLDTGEQERITENVHDDDVVAMVCTDDFVFTSSFSTIYVWDAVTLEKKGSITGLHHWVRALALNYGGDKLYSGSHNTIEVWDALGKFTLKGKINHKFGSIHSLIITSQHIIAGAELSEKKAGTYNQNIQVFDVTSQQHLYSLSGHLGTVTCLQVSPSGHFLFSSSSDNTIMIWNLENNLPIQSLTRHENGVNSIILHGDLLLSGAEDTEIKVFKYFSLG